MNFSSGWTGTLVASSGGMSWALGGMHSGCGLSPCGDEEVVVLGITCTAAVCDLLWLGNKTICSCGGTGGLGNVDLVLHVSPQSAHHYSSSLLQVICHYYYYPRAPSARYGEIFGKPYLACLQLD